VFESRCVSKSKYVRDGHRSVTIESGRQEEGATQLKSLFEPRAVAVIGASSKKGKIGYEILRNMVDGQFGGAIYPVNPHEEVILGLNVYRSISDVPDAVDTCIITVPPEVVPQVLLECGRKKVKGAVIISAGFSEIGNLELEKQVLESALKGGVRVIGPNCAGIINTEKRLYATIESRIAPGSIAFITQSGALGGAVLAWAREQRMGFSKFVSYGNRSDVDEAELLEYLSEDRQTRVIAVYIEGLRDGRRFIQVAKRVSMAKPILAIKSGYSSEGSRATLSHTGAMAGSDKIYDGAFRQAGIIRAEDVDDLLDMAKALSCQPPSRGDRIGVVTNSGGPGVMMVDALARLGLKAPESSAESRDKLAFLEGAIMFESGGVPNFRTLRRTAKPVWALVQRHRYLAPRLSAAASDSWQDRPRGSHP